MTQPRPLREQLKALEHLQELDLKIDHLKKSKAALPVSLKSLDDSFNKLQHQVNIKKASIVEIEKLQRQTQAAIDLNTDRMTRANSKLETVQNGQEFQAANKEIDQLKKLNDSLLEQIKKADGDVAIVKKDIDHLDTQMGHAGTERDSKSSTVNAQLSSLDGEINTLLAERKTLASIVDSRTLAGYDRVRVARNGVGISPAVGGRCGGCNMVVPPQLYNEVQKVNALQSCPSCHRILFVPMAQSSDSTEAAR